MKKKAVIIGIVILTAIFLSGCNEESESTLIDDILEGPEDNSIDLLIMGTAYVRNSTNHRIPNIQVRFDFSKADSDTVSLKRYTKYDEGDINLEHGVAKVTYNTKLNEGEAITVEARVSGSGLPGDTAFLSYSEAKSKALSEGEYTWHPQFELKINE